MRIKTLTLAFLTLILSTLVATAQDIPTKKDALTIELTIEKESLVTGPYARYAQQYLGVIAPLNNRVSHKIVGAKISKTNSNTQNINISQQSADINFNDMGLEPIVTVGGDYSINRTSSSEKSLQEMAVSASQAIFNLRKRRYEVITGELQDAYGAGIGAAVAEMTRLEQQYVALFLGKKAVTREVHTFSVLPSSDKSSYVLCRFSEQDGVIDILGSSGQQLVMTVVPENSIEPIVINKEEIQKNEAIPTAQFHMEWVTATIILDGSILANAMFELPQFGKMVKPTIVE